MMTILSIDDANFPESHLSILLQIYVKKLITHKRKNNKVKLY